MSSLIYPMKSKTKDASSIFSILNNAKQKRIETLTRLKNEEIEKLIKTKSASKIASGVETKVGKQLGTKSGNVGNFFKKRFKVSAISTLLVRGLMIFIGVLLIIQGILSVKTYESRNQKDTTPSAVVKSYDAASFFLGIGVGIIFHQALNLFDYKFVDELFVYLLLLGIGIFAGYITNRLSAISNESDTKKAQSIALSAESFSLGLIGAVVGIIISVTFITASKHAKGPLIIYIEVAGIILGSLIVAAACANQFYLYNNTGKNYKTGLIVSIIVFILSIFAIVGAIALAII